MNFIKKFFSFSEVAEDSNKNLAKIDISSHGDSEVISDKDVPSLASEEETSFEFINNEDVSSLDLEEDFEIINENINPPDSREKSIPASSYEINKSIAEIAGFNKEKLLEMCTFSKMTYGSNDKKLSEAGYKTRHEFREEGYNITSFLDSKGREAGLVFTRGKEVTIAYRGTQGYDDIITDVNASFTVPAFLPEGGRAHRGFYNALESSFVDLESVLESHAKAQKLEIKDLKINLTGHSMGGALAKLAALCLNKTKGAQDIHVATFGDPRVFDLTASEIYNEVLEENTIRVTQHRQDIVPAVMPGCTGYAHVGAQLRLEKSPNHTVHKTDGYYQGIKEIKERDFKSNNNVSLFYYPVRLLNILNCAVLGSAQRAIVKFSGREYLTPVEEKWHKEAMSYEETKKQTNTDLVEEEWEWYQVPHEEAKKQTNTEISLSKVNQIIEESRCV